MKLRTRFILSTLAFSAILLAITGSVINTNRLVEETNRQELLARTLVQETNELSYLSTAYLLYGENRQASLWEAKYESIANDLRSIDPGAPEERSAVDNLESYQRRLGAIFAEVRRTVDLVPRNAGGGLDQDSVRVSWSRMEVQNQTMISEASRLAQMLRDERDSLRQTSTILVLALIAAFGAFLLSSYLLTYRRIIGAISELQQGVEIVGSGDLNHPIPEKGGDEISELCRAFNRMAARLKELTASKAELEREIAARSRAEAERERLLQAEQEARALAESAVKIRDQFMSVAAHELKTPVTSLLGFSQVILRGLGKAGEVDTRRLAAAMQRIEQQSKRLNKLTEQLLNLSRLQSGKLVLAREETNLSALAERIMSDFRDAHPERAVELRDGGGETAYVDPVRIEQVVVNLLDNATKFSPTDSRIDLEVSTGAPGWVEVSVRDRGVGISPDKHEQIFERFYQVEPELNSGGMGIGLFVSQEIVQMHGGAIRVEQPEDGGSRFVVRLPQGADTPAAGEGAAGPGLEPE